MSKKLLTTDEEETKYYLSCLRSLSKDYFKLETLQKYADEYSPGFKDYQKGIINLKQLRSSLKDSLLSSPDSPYEKIHKEKINFRRVHIVKLPLSDYLLYEIESYKLSVELGEQIFLISQKETDKLVVSVKPQDLLLFDDKTVFLQHYNVSTGKWKYTELLDSLKEINPYLELKRQLLNKSLPMHEFIRKHR